MNIYRRRGHFRRGPGGGRYFVKSHDVVRENTVEANRRKTLPNRKFQDSLSFNVYQPITSRFVIPNAECPVCGQRVFFYRNEHGSAVWFDDLGPPWPKHACLDVHSSSQISDDSLGQPELPLLNTENAVLDKTNPKLSSVEDIASLFVQRYQQQPSKCYIIRDIRAAQTVCLLVASGVNSTSSGFDYFVSEAPPPSSLKQNDSIPVFWDEVSISFFDPDEMAVVHFKAKKLSGAEAYVRQLLDL